MKILFLGREKCAYTNSVHVLMEKMGHEVMTAHSREVGQELPAEVLASSGDLVFSFRSHFVVPRYFFPLTPQPSTLISVLQSTEASELQVSRFGTGKRILVAPFTRWTSDSIQERYSQ